MTIYKNILSTATLPGCPDSLWRQNSNINRWQIKLLKLKINFLDSVSNIKLKGTNWANKCELFYGTTNCFNPVIV